MSALEILIQHEDAAWRAYNRTKHEGEDLGTFAHAHKAIAKNAEYLISKLEPQPLV